MAWEALINFCTKKLLENPGTLLYKLFIMIIFALEEEQLLSSERQDDGHTVGGPARSATHGNEFTRNQKAKVKILP